MYSQWRMQMTSSNKTTSKKWIKALTVGAALTSAIAAILAALIGQEGIPGLAKNDKTTQPNISLSQSADDITEEGRNNSKTKANSTVREANAEIDLALPKQVAQYAPQTITGSNGNAQVQGNDNNTTVKNSSSPNTGNSSNNTSVSNENPNNVTNCTGGGTNTNCGSGGTFNTTVNGK